MRKNLFLIATVCLAMSQNMAAQDKLYNDEFPLSDVTLLEGPLKHADI